MAPDSAIAVPSASSSTGVRASGLRRRYSGEAVSPAKMSTPTRR